MPKKNPPTGTDADLNMATMLPLFTDEDKSREFLESKRWANGRRCPRCQCEKTYALKPKAGSKSPVRPGVYKCSGCRKQFTVRIGTIFEDSRLPLRKWLMAIHLMTAAKKGISSHQLARQLDITQKTAWFVCHRLREAMTKEPMAGMLKGEVECDETYVGARKPRYKNTSKPGRGTPKKPVAALVERGGNVVAMPVDRCDGKTLKGNIKTLVDESSTIITDEWASYRGIGQHFTGGHKVVNHKVEYVRIENGEPTLVTTNTAESFFALFKRAHYGTHHKMSVKHLHRYVTECEFKWNTRKVSDGERMVEAIKGAEGKRLMYREPR